MLISIVGGECTGKTSLAEDLASRTAGFIVVEALREFVVAHARTPYREEQSAIAHAQRAAELLALTRYATVIADPAPLMTAVYSQVYFADDSLVAEGTEWLLTARLVVWCRPDIPWVADPGQRDGPSARAEVDRALASHVARWRAEGIVVHEARGSRSHRLASTCAALEASGALGDLDS